MYGAVSFCFISGIDSFSIAQILQFSCLVNDFAGCTAQEMKFSNKDLFSKL